MMNPVQLVQMMRSNPQQLFQTMMRNNPSLQNNPVVQNAIQLAESKDEKGLEQLARNLCQANNIDVQQMLEQLKGQFKM